MSSIRQFLSELWAMLKMVCPYMGTPIFALAFIASVFLVVVSIVVYRYFYNENSAGVVYAALATAGTFWAVLNTIQILDNQAAKISNFDDLLDRISDEFEKIGRKTKYGEDKEAVKKEKICIMSYTPAIGHVSAGKQKYENYERWLLDLITWGVDTKIVCLSKEGRTRWYEDLNLTEDGKNNNNVKVQHILETALKYEGQKFELNLDQMSPVFVIRTTHKDFYFIAKPKKEGKTNEGMGLSTRDPHIREYLNTFFEHYVDLAKTNQRA